jgi:predicted branched-subunit amino acid permease
MLGFGALAFASGFDVWLSIACSAGIWALPGQIVLIEMSLAGAPGVATVIAVMLTAARFFPMTLAFMPHVRDPQYNRLTVYGAAHLLSMTSWAWTMRRIPDMPRDERLAYFIGFAGTCWAVSIVATAAGYYLAGSFPPLLRLGFLFLNPLYLVVLLVGDARTALAFAALACGAIAGPLLHVVSPEWGVLLTGLVGGTVAYFVQRAWNTRDA